jgi:hypothetical protein
MSYFYAGKFYPPNPNSRVWKAGSFIDGITSTGVAPEGRGLINISDVNNLQGALDGKSDVGHHHGLSDIDPTPIAENGNIDGGTFF